MKIFVVTHKISQKVAKSPLYEFLLVGADKNKGLSSYRKDNEFEDNISNLNGSFCEITGLYWMWKHVDEAIVGLNHYRRYFVSELRDKKQKQLILTEQEIAEALDGYDIILPERGHNEFKGEKAGEFFCRIHDVEVWENCRQIIATSYPDYLPDFEWFEQETTGYICNMFIANKTLLNDYCDWLFDILFQLDQTIDYQKYSNYNRRMIGFVAERLLNIWVHHHQLKVKEYPIYVTESEDYIKFKRRVQRKLFSIKKKLGLIQ